MGDVLLTFVEAVCVGDESILPRHLLTQSLAATQFGAQQMTYATAVANSATAIAIGDLTPAPEITREQFAAKFLPTAEQRIADERTFEDQRSVNVKVVEMRFVNNVRLFASTVTEEQLPQTGRWACELLREKGYTVEVDFCGGVEGREQNVGIFVMLKALRCTDAQTPEEFNQIWIPKAVKEIKTSRDYNSRRACAFKIPLNTIKLKWYQHIIGCNFTEEQLPEQGKWACAAVRALGHQVEVFYSSYAGEVFIYAVFQSGVD